MKAHVIEDILQPQNSMKNMINDVHLNLCLNFNDLLSSLMKGKIGQNMAHDRDNAEFYELLKDGNQQLCKWCTKYLKLSFPVNLYLIKCLCIQNCHFLLR